jgi:hypothetical protein
VLKDADDKSMPPSKCGFEKKYSNEMNVESFFSHSNKTISNSEPKMVAVDNDII